MKSIKELSESPTTQEDDSKWIVKDIIKKESINILFADPACGKTQLMAHLATAISDGKDFLGHKTNKVKILFISTESSYDNVYQRFKKTKLKNLENVVLDCDNDITPMNLGFKASEFDLIIIDILVDYFSQNGTDQNNYSDVYKVFSGLRQSSLLKDKAFMLVSHFNKKGLPMNSQAFLAAADTRMFMYAPNGINTAYRKIKWYGKQVEHTEINVLFDFKNIKIIKEDLSNKAEQFNVVLAIIMNYVHQKGDVNECASSLINKLQLYKLGCYETNLTKILNDNIDTLKENGIKMTTGRNHKGRFIKLGLINKVTDDGDSTAIGEDSDNVSKKE